MSDTKDALRSLVEVCIRCGVPLRDELLLDARDHLDGYVSNEGLELDLISRIAAHLIQRRAGEGPWGRT